jgi:hypothetical protein
VGHSERKDRVACGIYLITAFEARQLDVGRQGGVGGACRSARRRWQGSRCGGLVLLLQGHAAFVHWVAGGRAAEGWVVVAATTEGWVVLAAEGWVMATAEVWQDRVAMEMAAGALDKVVAAAGAESCLLMRWCWPCWTPCAAS